MEGLRALFETDYLRLDFSRNAMTRIPPWLFDYPPECYSERNAAIAAVRSPGFVLPRSDCPLGLLVLIGRVAHLPTENQLPEESLALSRRMADGAMPTRPVLFLHVLDRFCRAARERQPFPADTLRRILYSPDSRAMAGYADDTTPLAVLDPLHAVKELLDVLESVARTCAERAVAFTAFRLAGVGVFQGRRNAGNWQTIFAYCGGWRKLANGGMVKCGRSPLFLGQNEACNGINCGKLICDQCGYCSEACALCAPRQAAWTA
jgi:hypothetical protein